MAVATRINQNINPHLLKKLLRVRKAVAEDVDAIYEVACSVGSSEKVSEQGFLVDDYRSDPNYYKMKIRKGINSLDHFYVAEYDKIYAFMIAYNKEAWLQDNPQWIEEVYWSPEFDMRRINHFVVVDKTAVYADLTGMGIGSLIYKRLIEDLKAKNIDNIFAETIISPAPNFASLQFRKKQNYSMAGVRYEQYKGTLYTDLIYHKQVE